MILLSPTNCIRKLLAAVQAPVTVSAYAKRLAHMMISMTTADCLAELTKTSRISFQRRFLYTNTPTIKPYTAATAAASVAVNMPP